jgi:hypothetical protein
MEHGVEGVKMRDIRLERVPSPTDLEMPREFLTSPVTVALLLKEPN